jgi:hypothetical protein
MPDVSPVKIAVAKPVVMRFRVTNDPLTHRSVFAPQNPAPVIRQDFVEDEPLARLPEVGHGHSFTAFRTPFGGSTSAASAISSSLVSEAISRIWPVSDRRRPVI